MRSFLFFSVASVALGLSSGCSEAHTTPPADASDGPDAGGTDGGGGDPDGGPIEPDAGPIEVDAFVPPPDTGIDAGPPVEPCTMPGAIETVGCGMCGSQDRFCTSALVWEYGPCTDGPGAECMPGTAGMAPCGMCGTQRRLCGTDCRFVDSGSCTGETGVCFPGASERDTTGCTGGGSRRRVCEDSCAWGPYDACTMVPSDLDGDGDPYGTDCDDGDASVGVGSTRTCGSFRCGTSTTMTTGTSTCVGPGWSECTRPMSCGEASCAPGQRETRSCASECLPAPTQSRTCLSSGTWGLWSMCASAGGTPAVRPPECASIVETSCGACMEGIAYAYCDASCTVRTSACTGAGCTPGATGRSTTGCPMGEYRESVCTAMCTPSVTSCMPYPPDVDVMILVDVTGSHTALVRGNAGALATELAAPLLADADVRVGVATFADFDTGPFGGAGDLPFAGLLAPTASATMVESTLRGLMGMGGGDGPESGVHALFELAGGTSHPESRPFMCGAGLEAGGCWRPGSQRIVVLITDITQHNGPEPGDPTMVHAPYSGAIMPAPASWMGARDAMRAARVGLFAIVPAGLTWGMYDTSGQMSIMVRDLGQDAASSVVTYPSGASDITAAIRTAAANIAAYVGI